MLRGAAGYWVARHFYNQGVGEGGMVRREGEVNTPEAVTKNKGHALTSVATMVYTLDRW